MGKEKLNNNNRRPSRGRFQWIWMNMHSAKAMLLAYNCGVLSTSIIFSKKTSESKEISFRTLIHTFISYDGCLKLKPHQNKADRWISVSLFDHTIRQQTTWLFSMERKKDAVWKIIVLFIIFKKFGGDFLWDSMALMRLWLWCEIWHAN